MPPAVADDALWVEELDREGFEAASVEWDALVERSPRPEPFFRHAFVRMVIDHFEPRAKLKFLAARQRGRLVAALPLVEEEGRMVGVPVRRLRAPVSHHSCRFDVPCEAGRDDAVQAMFSHLRATTRFDVLEIGDVPPGGRARMLLDRASAEGFPTGTYETLRSPFIPLEGGARALRARLDRRFEANLRRRRRRLSEKGRLRLERSTGGSALEALLEEGFSLEKQGWKGKSGTAIDCEPRVRGFYGELSRVASLRGELTLYFLRLDERAVAFQLGLTCGGSYYVLKVAYDEAHAASSPGQLLAESVLIDLCERGLSELDFLPAMPWKQDWTSEFRRHHVLYVFGRGWKGRALHQLKFTVVPVVKEVSRWRP
jgi:CelD/BcsL family acetyltransferase involved in cellulose biosynthesis